MTKALLKKEFLQIKKMYLTNKRNGKEAGKGMFIFLIICYFIVMASMGALFSLFAAELVPAGEGWVYYFFVTAMGFLFGIIGSVFTTAEMLFRAKDNEVLMAMPIPPSKIVFVRMVGVYIMGLIYELLMLLPGIVVYFIFGGFSLVTLLFGILGIVLLGFVILAFSCFFGWIIAILMAKLKNQKILTVIISVIFIALFIYLRFKANDFFRMLSENAHEIGKAIQGWGYPLYALGLGMSGNVLGLLAFAAIAGVLFGITYWLISRSFYKIINIKPTEKAAVFKEEQIRSSSVGKALYRKEVKRFTSNPGYMLNCGLGILFLVAGAVISIIMSGSVRDLLSNITASFPQGETLIFVIVAFAVCMLTGFIDISAPSISLEGHSIWMLQSMPITPMQVLMAKFKMAVSFTAIPAVLCAVVVQIVAGAGVLVVILSGILAAAYSIFIVLLGLRLDLGKPFLDWTNETQPVKQNTAVLFTLLIGMLGPIIPGGLYIICMIFMKPEIYLAVWIVIYLGISILIVNWFRNKGIEKFALLGQ